MTIAEFSKYEGLGNDFIVVEAARDDGGAELSAALCDRHFGVGADGVLWVLPPSLPSAAAKMVVYNADGSRPEMCGNGLRCVALHLVRSQTGHRARFSVETDAGPRLCDVDAEVSDRGAARVTIELGAAELLPDYECEHAGSRYRFARVSTGNPHAILFDAELDPHRLDELGPAVSEALGGSNVEFVSGAASFDVLVWERGVGRTLACGTGAGAVVAAAARLGRAPYDEPVAVRLPGGELGVKVERSGQKLWLTGPARLVFQGRLFRG